MTRAEALAWGRGVRDRVTIPAAVRALVVERQGGEFCVSCRALELVTPADVPFELDHKQSLHLGGDNHHLNLELLCRSHNRSKADRAPGGVLRRPRWERRRPHRAG